MKSNGITTMQVYFILVLSFSLVGVKASRYPYNVSRGRFKCPAIHEPLCASNGLKYVYFENQCYLDVRNYQEKALGRQEYIVCPLNRCHPQCKTCPDVDDPVCVIDVRTQQLKQFKNPCEVEFVACSFKKYYRLLNYGSCPQTTDCSISTCSKDYQPLCVNYKTMNREFSNDCVFQKSLCENNMNWQTVQPGPCYSSSIQNQGYRRNFLEAVCASHKAEHRTFQSYNQLQREIRRTGKYWSILHTGFCKDQRSCRGEIIKPVCAKLNTTMIKSFLSPCHLREEKAKTGQKWVVLYKGLCRTAIALPTKATWTTEATTEKARKSGKEFENEEAEQTVSSDEYARLANEYFGIECVAKTKSQKSTNSQSSDVVNMEDKSLEDETNLPPETIPGDIGRSFRETSKSSTTTTPDFTNISEQNVQLEFGIMSDAVHPDDGRNLVRTDSKNVDINTISKAVGSQEKLNLFQEPGLINNTSGVSKNGSANLDEIPVNIFLLNEISKQDSSAEESLDPGDIEDGDIFNGNNINSPKFESNTNQNTENNTEQDQEGGIATTGSEDSLNQEATEEQDLFKGNNMNSPEVGSNTHLESENNTGQDQEGSNGIIESLAFEFDNGLTTSPVPAKNDLSHRSEQRISNSSPKNEIPNLESLSKRSIFDNDDPPFDPETDDKRLKGNNKIQEFDDFTPDTEDSENPALGQQNTKAHQSSVAREVGTSLGDSNKNKDRLMLALEILHELGFFKDVFNANNNFGTAKIGSNTDDVNESKTGRDQETVNNNILTPIKDNNSISPGSEEDEDLSSGGNSSQHGDLSDTSPKTTNQSNNSENSAHSNNENINRSKSNNDNLESDSGLDPNDNGSDEATSLMFTEREEKLNFALEVLNELGILKEFIAKDNSSKSGFDKESSATLRKEVVNSPTSKSSTGNPTNSEENAELFDPVHDEALDKRSNNDLTNTTGNSGENVVPAEVGNENLNSSAISENSEHGLNNEPSNTLDDSDEQYSVEEDDYEDETELSNSRSADIPSPKTGIPETSAAIQINEGLLQSHEVLSDKTNDNNASGNPETSELREIHEGLLHSHEVLSDKTNDQNSSRIPNTSEAIQINEGLLQSHEVLSNTANENNSSSLKNSEPVLDFGFLSDAVGLDDSTSMGSNSLTNTNTTSSGIDTINLETIKSMLVQTLSPNDTLTLTAKSPNNGTLKVTYNGAVYTGPSSYSPTFNFITLPNQNILLSSITNGSNNSHPFNPHAFAHWPMPSLPNHNNFTGHAYTKPQAIAPVKAYQNHKPQLQSSTPYQAPILPPTINTNPYPKTVVEYVQPIKPPSRELSVPYHSQYPAKNNQYNGVTMSVSDYGNNLNEVLYNDHEHMPDISIEPLHSTTAVDYTNLINSPHDYSSISYNNFDSPVQISQHFDFDTSDSVLNYNYDFDYNYDW